MRSQRPSPGPAALGLLATALVATALLGLASCALPVAPADRYAIVVGITLYANAGDNLFYPAADANSMADLLRSTGWTVDSTDVLTNSQATKSAIQSHIAALAGRVSANSSVLVYYSGHGTLGADNQTAYIVPYDGVSASTGYAVESNCIKSSELSSWLLALPARNRLVVLDSCYSGGFVSPGSSIDAAPADYGPYDGGTTHSSLSLALEQGGALLGEAFSRQADPSILTITAAGSQELSYDDPGHSHGAFTYWLLQAGVDSSADLDHNGLVTATEAYAYAKAQLQANWNSIYYLALVPITPGVYETDRITGLPIHADFLPRISGGSGDLVLYDMR